MSTRAGTVPLSDLQFLKIYFNRKRLRSTPANLRKMLAAQKEPEKYRNLRVRLGGLSAYFVTLSKEMQNSIIKRTEHSL